MIKTLIIFWVLVSMFTAMPVYAQVVPNKEPILTRIGDWFATEGKTEEEKHLIMAKRRRYRKIKKAKKELARKRRKMAKQRRSYLQTR